MKNVSIEQFVRLQRELNEERGELQARLQQINQALGDMPLPSLSQVQGATGRSTAPAARRGRRGGRSSGGSLREQVLGVLQSGPMTKEQILDAVQKRGYKFSTNNPLNSLGVILYGKNPRFNRADGKFSIKGSATQAQGSQPIRRGGKRKMSPEARARIAAAQRARWANQKGATVKAASNGGSAKPKRKVSTATRKAIAEAARKRWAAAKAAGRSTL